LSQYRTRTTLIYQICNIHKIMSQYLKDQAWRHIDKANSQVQRGEYNDALASLAIAEEFARKAKASDILSAVFATTASAFQSMGKFGEALEMHTTALNIQEDLAKTEHFFNTWVAMTLNNLGALLDNLGRPEEAKEKFERALEMCESLLATDPQSSVYQSQVAMALNNLGALLYDMGRPEDVKEKFERALKIRELLLATDSQSSVYKSDVAMTLNNLGALLDNLGRTEEAKEKYECALKMRELLLATDSQSSVYKSDVAMTLNNLGALLDNLGRAEEAKEKYECALEMRESLLATDPQNSVYQSQVAMTFNNLGSLLDNVGRTEEAKEKYEHTLEMRKLLLATDPQNSVYQSQVATTLNNLGALLKNMGRQEDALNCYQKSLEIYIGPMQYLTIKTKTRVIINIVQLVSECAEKSTNTYRKLNYFKKVYGTYVEHEHFFSKYELVHEKRLVKEAGLGAHIQYLMINARNEDDKEKRIEEYETCIREVEQIAETEDDEKLKELWISVIYYLKGRQFVNRAMQSDPPDRELMKKAIEQFESAKDRYKQANVCYCIYTVLLELESIEVLDDEAVSRMKNLLKHAIESLPDKMDNTVTSAFHEIEVLLDNRNLKTDPEMFENLNKCISKIDYYALREHFSHISSKIITYLKEPFKPNVSYGNWELHITFDEPEKVQGKLTIKAGDRVIFDEPLVKRNRIHIEHRPVAKDETITFITEKGRNVTRGITYSEVIKCDNGYIDVNFLEHDCKRPNTGGKFNIAIVQLKYHLKKEGHALVIEDDEAYHMKVTAILDAVKGKANLVVFPEFSIPFDYLPEMKEYSDENGIVIVAGSHYITDNNLGEYDEVFYDEFNDDDLRKNMSPVIIPSSNKIYHTEKIIGAKSERPLFSKEGMTHGSMNRIFRLNDDVTFGVIICFDFLHDDLRKIITDACNVILVPQTNPGTERFHKIGHGEIDNLRGAGNKAYIMASGIFTYDDGNDKKDIHKNIMGGDSGVILTLDKDSRKEPKNAIIESIKVDRNEFHEQFIQMASLNMQFNSARDTQMGQVPIIDSLIHIFEENEVFQSAKDGKNPQAFLDLLETINSCGDTKELKQILADNGPLIRCHSPLIHEKISGDLKNLHLDEIKDKCTNIIIKRSSQAVPKNNYQQHYNPR